MASLYAQQNLKMIERYHDDVRKLAADMFNINERLLELLALDQDTVTNLESNFEIIVNHMESIKRDLLRPGDHTGQLEHPPLIEINALRERLHAQMLILVKWFKQLREERQQEHDWGQEYRNLLNEVVLLNDLEDQTRKAANVERGNENASQTESSRVEQALSMLEAEKAAQREVAQVQKDIIRLHELRTVVPKIVELREELILAFDKSCQKITDLESFDTQIQEGIKVAHGVRRMKWWCTGIGVLIVLVIGLVLGLFFGLKKHR